MCTSRGATGSERNARVMSSIGESLIITTRARSVIRGSISATLGAQSSMSHVLRPRPSRRAGSIYIRSCGARVGKQSAASPQQTSAWDKWISGKLWRAMVQSTSWRSTYVAASKSGDRKAKSTPRPPVRSVIRARPRQPCACKERTRSTLYCAATSPEHCSSERAGGIINPSMAAQAGIFFSKGWGIGGVS